MPIHPEPDPNASEKAFARLRSQQNPFAATTVVAGTEDECLAADVPEIFDSQRTDLLGVVELYRRSNQPSRVFPVLGERGVGKSHLLLRFRAEMAERPFQRGSGTLVFVADNYSDRLDSVDFFLWQVVNHLLGRSEGKARVLRSLANMTTARLLSEALCRATIPEKIQMFPWKGFWTRLSLWSGLGGAARDRVERADRLATICEETPAQDMAAACREIGVSSEVALSMIHGYLDRTESKDLTGTFRRQLYSRMAQLALTDDREPLEEFLTQGYLMGTESGARSGHPSRTLLKTLLELFHTFEIATVLVFDQLEDFLRAPSQEGEDQLRRAFSQSLAALVNHVPGLCIFAFAERGLWNDVSMKMDPYARDRLMQPFSLPGRPLQSDIGLPASLTRTEITRIIQKRVRPLLTDLDLTGLDDTFPFREADLENAHEWQTVRVTLKELARKYDANVHSTADTVPIAVPVAVFGGDEPPSPPPIDGTVINGAYLRARWQTSLASARKTVQDGVSSALIPDVQTSLDVWLRFLKELEVPGTENWAKVELITDTEKGPYGYLNVLRLGRAADPGIGIAVWLGEGTGKPVDLERRLTFFKNNPCPIKTLVLLRESGKATLTGRTKLLHTAAIDAGRDLRVVTYQKAYFEALIAFTRWYHMIQPEVQLAGEEGQRVLKEYVPKGSDKLLEWIKEWSSPVVGAINE